MEHARVENECQHLFEFSESLFLKEVELDGLGRICVDFRSVRLTAARKTLSAQIGC